MVANTLKICKKLKELLKSTCYENNSIRLFVADKSYIVSTAKKITHLLNQQLHKEYSRFSTEEKVNFIVKKPLISMIISCYILFTMRWNVSL